MATDIMTPLLLVPKFEILYAIDKHDGAFSREGTWESQKDEIRTMLRRGNDETSYTREVYIQCGPNNVHTLPGGPSQITYDCDRDSRWVLEFVYDGTARKMIYHHSKNFLDEWPREIRAIGHLMLVGAEFTAYLRDREYRSFVRTIEPRISFPSWYYALLSGHENFPETMIIRCGSKREGTEMARAPIAPRDFTRPRRESVLGNGRVEDHDAEPMVCYVYVSQRGRRVRKVRTLEENKKPHGWRC